MEESPNSHEPLHKYRGQSVMIEGHEYATVKQKLKDELFRLEESILGCLLGTEVILKEINDLLTMLEGQYPKDPDLKMLRNLYNDLDSDFKDGDEPLLDESLEDIIEDAEAQLAESGVCMQSPEESDIPDVIGMLKEAGVNPEYVVYSGNPKAKTIVYFMQIHGDGETRNNFSIAGTKISQQAIFDDLESVIERGGVANPLIFVEGGEKFKNTNREALTESVFRSLQEVIGLANSGESEEFDLNSKYMAKIAEAIEGTLGVLDIYAPFRMKDKYGDRVTLEGIEEIGGMPAFMADYRVTAINVFLADNIATVLDQSKQEMAFLVLGGGHEKSYTSRRVLPISHLLASKGVNVVVVDHASRFILPGQKK